jgi:PHD/YefM family antitoxin component YafN of YafNO toxin-antitoxin module
MRLIISPVAGRVKNNGIRLELLTSVHTHVQEVTMPQKSMTIIQARYKLTSLPMLFAKDSSTVEVTKRGKPVMAVLPWDAYESLVETLEIMGDAELMASIRKGLEQIDKGRTVTFDEV